MLFHKFDGSVVNEEYKQGYFAGLMMHTKSTAGKSLDFYRGYHDAMNDTVELEPENCC